MSRRANKLYITPAWREADARAFAPLLRQADRNEVYATSGLKDYRRVLELSIAISAKAWAVRTLAKSEPVMIGGWSGVTPLTGRAALWMLGTDLFIEHYREVCRRVRVFLSERAEKPVSFHNYIDARNAASLRFVKFLGATIEAPAPFGAQQLPFQRFELRVE